MRITLESRRLLAMYWAMEYRAGIAGFESPTLWYLMSHTDNILGWVYDASHYTVDSGADDRYVAVTKTIPNYDGEYNITKAFAMVSAATRWLVEGTVINLVTDSVYAAAAAEMMPHTGASRKQTARVFWFGHDMTTGCEGIGSNANYIGPE